MRKRAKIALWSDSGPESVYGVLAEALIAEVASGRLNLQ
jgi:hypothetical protein